MIFDKFPHQSKYHIACDGGGGGRFPQEADGKDLKFEERNGPGVRVHTNGARRENIMDIV